MSIQDVCKIIMQELGQIRVSGRDDCRHMIAAMNSLQAIIDALDANATQQKEEKPCN